MVGLGSSGSGWVCFGRVVRGVEMYYDKEGREVGVEEWSALFEQGDRHVARDEISEKSVVVSTVWIGLSWALEVEDGGRPLIFETMVFPEDSYEDLLCYRWATADEAKAGHERLVRDIVAGNVELQ